MTLRDEIEAIRNRAIKNLNAAHDYYTYAQRAWRALQQVVENEGLKFSWRNISTHSTINEQNFPALAQQYVEQELTSSTFQQFVSIFENFLSDSLRLWLLAYPRSISKRQLSGKDILALPDKPAIVNALVEKELREVFYDRPANWFEYLRGHVGIASPTDAEAVQFSEIKATRDVLVHGQGIANAYYVDKAGASAQRRRVNRLIFQNRITRPVGN